MDDKNPGISWHPAFVEAIQLELKEFEYALEFLPEFPLTDEPLRIDCVVIQKTKDITIKKNIAAIFREWNLLEYKSPSDYISIADFYKVYAYACLYASLEKVPITNMTVSFVGSRYPRDLIEHLRKVRKNTVEETDAGIYTIGGDILPMQLIDSRKLSAEENLWLKSLRGRLNMPELEQINMALDKQGKDARVGAYANAILRANIRTIQEATKMYTMQTLKKAMKEAGWTAEWEAEGEAKGEERKAIDIARKMKNAGKPLSEIADFTGVRFEANDRA